MPRKKTSGPIKASSPNSTVVKMALDIADHSARNTILRHCEIVVPADTLSQRAAMLDTNKVSKPNEAAVTQALAYLELRKQEPAFQIQRNGSLIWFSGEEFESATRSPNPIPHQ